MSLSLPGAPGISMARRSMLRSPSRRAEGSAARRTPVAAVPPISARLAELADALGRIQGAAGLDARAVATRLLEQLDPASPLRLVDVFAAGRTDLVSAYLDGTLDGTAVLRAWQR